MSSELPIDALGTIMKKFLQKKIEEAISRPVNSVLDSSRNSDRLAEQQRKINIDLLKKNNIEQKKNVNKGQQNKLNNEQKKISIELQKKTNSTEQKHQVNTEQQIKINLNLQQKYNQKPGVDTDLQIKNSDNQYSANSNSTTRDYLAETKIGPDEQQTIPIVLNQVNNQTLANIKIEEKVNIDKQDSPIFESLLQPNKTQPPLPQHPPPPDLPLISVKKELTMMDDYNTMNVAKQEDTVPHSIQTDKTNENRPKMCREFVRGLCTRGATCKYSHVLDVTQLKKVYKFCWDFQNKKCNRKVCKHVHATVFEEQHFYRTGYLPPHVFNKSVNTNVTHQSTPTPGKDYQIDFSTFFTEPPPSEPPPTMPSVSSFTASTSFARPSETVSAVSSSSISPTKRDWVDMNFSGRPSRDPDYSEVMPKKCKMCDPTEKRLQEMKTMAANLSRNSEEMNQTMMVLTEKSNLLYKLLFAILEQSPSFKLELRGLGNKSPMFN